MIDASGDSELTPTPTMTGAQTASLAAAAAAEACAKAPLRHRAEWLCAMADRLEEAQAALVDVAHRETHLSRARLGGEVLRTTSQLRMFASAILEGSHLEVAIDHADPTISPPRPDLRRMLVPLGPVAVFAASNFPFAFSVAGGDTASSLAAGCPVIVKAHPGHPELSRMTASVVREALDACGAPHGVFALVEGFHEGRELVVHPAIRAVAFTGSLSAGRALADLVAARSEPIPFYGELGSLNPVIITRSAALSRGPELAAGLVASVTQGAGQFCTKPGLVLAPADSAFIDEVVAAARDMQTPARLLTPSITTAYADSVTSLAESEGVRVLVGQAQPTDGTSTPMVFMTDAATVTESSGALLQERFGPCTLIVRYESSTELFDILQRLPGSLTATIHAESDDHLEGIVDAVAPRVGRLLFRGWPTGVAVTWAQHHGGPWPATTSQHTSVGVTAMRRFLRPIVWQDGPEGLLPPELLDRNPLGVSRRVNNRMEPAVAQESGDDNRR